MHQDVNIWRLQLRKAINNKATADSLFTQLNKIGTPSPLVKAYIAALYAIKAKDDWNPYNKIKLLESAEGSFRSAVADDPHDIEIRFLRLSVEVNLPLFLSMDKNINGDKVEIIEQLQAKNYPGNNNMELTKSIIQFVIDSKKCTPQELQQLKQQLADLK